MTEEKKDKPEEPIDFWVCLIYLFSYISIPLYYFCKRDVSRYVGIQHESLFDSVRLYSISHFLHEPISYFRYLFQPTPIHLVFGESSLHL